MEVTQILLDAQVIDSAKRKHAEQSLKQFRSQNLPAFLLSLSEELANDQKPLASRKLAGLILKHGLGVKYKFSQRWLQFDMAVRCQIKSSLLLTLFSTTPDARSNASQVIAKVAGLEMPHKQWPELVPTLLSNVQQVSPHLKQATLETLGYVCEEVKPDVIDQDEVNKILTAVVQGMNSNECNTEVRYAAIRALYNALGFARANFCNDMERDYIMKVVCEAARSPVVKIRQAAFECLVSIGSMYYEKLATYIQDIFNITSMAFLNDEEPLALQAIEFWNSICEKEIGILEEYGGNFTVDSDIPFFNFVRQALPALVPLLLQMLLQQEEDQDEDIWNRSTAGGTCLGLVSRTVGDDIVPIVMPFIQENITKPDWRQREAATFAIGAILEGPSPNRLIPLISIALNLILTALTNDTSNHVKDTTGWTLERIFEFLHGSTSENSIVTPTNLQPIITVLLQSMRDAAPNVADKACGALRLLAQGLEDVGPPSPLTPYFQEIIRSLLDTTHRANAGESRLRTAAYETLNQVIRSSLLDETSGLLLELVRVIMDELHNTLDAQTLFPDKREKQSEVQGELCRCLQVIIQKLRASNSLTYALMQYADQIMSLFLRVFSCRNGTVHEEAMLAIGAFAHLAGPTFEKYVPELYKYLEMGLQNFKEYQVCAVTVGVVRDVCKALGGKILPYCDGIVTLLLKNLSSNELHRSVKPSIFSCFGDIAVSIGENFEKYLMYAIPMLQSAAELCARTSGRADGFGNAHRAAMIEYANLLRIGILEAYSGMFQGFKNSPKTQLLMPYAPHILQFLDSMYIAKDMDDAVMKAAVVVLGDLADTLGSNATALMQQSLSSKDFLNECLSSKNHLLKESAEWASVAIARAISV